MGTKPSPEAGLVASIAGLDASLDVGRAEAESVAVEADAVAEAGLAALALRPALWL